MRDGPTSASAIVSAVAERTRTPEDELPPLYESIDVDAIQALLAHAADRPGAAPSVTFPYAGCTVTVDPDGTVRVEVPGENEATDTNE
ncbi:HalOD1 output domain-containing protein [Halobaculum litoreum]|uniref:HalOD1 output domain-containing protein n=1 Tax=Halobaculum litoreum TaxID=3031998 RepID=A0ABD5XY66_9EURY